MRIYLASDHAGFALKKSLVEFLKNEGHTVEDLGPAEYNEHDDYPDYCIPLAHKVAQDKGTFGIVIGLSGQGEAMAANRVPGARAAVYYGPCSGGQSPNDILKLSREHNDANILSLGAAFVPDEEAKKAVGFWLAIPFSEDERHRRRIDKLDN